MRNGRQRRYVLERIELWPERRLRCARGLHYHNVRCTLDRHVLRSPTRSRRRSTLQDNSPLGHPRGGQASLASKRRARLERKQDDAPTSRRRPGRDCRAARQRSHIFPATAGAPCWAYGSLSGSRACNRAAALTASWRSAPSHGTHGLGSCRSRLAQLHHPVGNLSLSGG